MQVRLEFVNAELSKKQVDDETIIVERSEDSKIENFSSYFGIDKEPKIEKERGADLIDVSKEVRTQWRL